MMKSIRHWDLRYVIARLKEIRYQRNNRDLPWLTEQANQILGTYLDQNDTCLEFGSGRSTVWLAQRVHSVISIEHNRSWYREVERLLASKAIENVRYVEASVSDERSDVDAKKYTEIFNSLQPSSIDFVLVDGIFRADCVAGSIESLRPGGLLVIDNVNRYLPSDTRSPFSRSGSDGPLDEKWAQVWLDISEWRHIWTSSGITDTAFFFKPESLN